MNGGRLLGVVDLPFDLTDMDPETFWGKILEIENGAGVSQFEMLGTFMCNLLSLPHVNVDVERIFSSVNLIKTRTRNSLKTKTVCALLRTKDGIKTAGGCAEFVPSKKLKNIMNAGIYRDDSCSEEEDY